MGQLTIYNLKNQDKSNKGFTLIELLFAMSIISILASLSWGAFYVYKEDAEYSKAERLIHDAQTSIMLGNMEAAPGFSQGYTVTDTSGGPVDNALAGILPGAVTPKDVRLGAMLSSCSGGSDTSLNLFLVAQPCKAGKEIQWSQFCDGTTLLQGDLSGGGCS